jgi:putative intracellular protease/amidase
VQVTILIFDGVTALDAVGPYDVLSRIPAAEVALVGPDAGPKRTEQKSLALVADHPIDEAAQPDVLVVPGGLGTHPLMHDEHVLDWIRTVHEGTRWTTSVCTGSLLLGAAGLLKGLKATTHWMAQDMLTELGAEPTLQRVVEQGKIVTAAGVSAGIDMALRLVQRELGDDVAQAIQLGIEYDPQPPFDAGSPEKAPPQIVEAVRRFERTS